MMRNEPEKIEWHGKILSIQPRTTVWRYRLDNRTHSHIGYNLFLNGEAEQGWRPIFLSPFRKSSKAN